jgi:hypothetical protein
VAVRPRRALNEQERRDLIVRQGELSSLAKHTAWPVLKAVVEGREESFRREASAALISTGMDQERQAFIRGFLKGMQYVLAVPDGAEPQLEALLRRQEKQ